MLISCEKCSTTYVLDDKLIPAQGAPVQCTRCGHVFLAKAQTGAAAEGPKSTQMFGSPDPAPPAPATNRTQMFGAAGAGGSPGTNPNNKTVMFGVPGAEPAPQNTGTGAAANRTMMFGHNADEAPPAPPAANPNKTVMFGAPGSEAPGTGAAAAHAAGGANRTMMFGAPGSVGPVPSATGSDAPTNRTMMFGAPGSDAAPPAAQATNRTMVFGTPAAQAQGAHAPDAQGSAGGQNKTMMFGVDGAPAAGAGANPRSTVMFGAPTAQPAPQTPPPRNTTMMFGTPAAQAQGAQPPPAAQKTSSTMMFGTPVGAQPPAQPAAPANAKSSSTMIFGATPVVSAGPSKAPKLTESTVRIGPDDLERMMREHEGRGDGGLTPPESTPAATTADRHNKTQMFAMGDQPEGATPPAGNDAVARQNNTQMFAMTPELSRDGAAQTPIQGRKTRSSQAGDKQPATNPNLGGAEAKTLDPSILDTFPPDGARRPEGSEGGPVIVDPPSKKTTQPNLGSVDGPRAELPPEAPDLLQQPGLGPTVPVSPVEADPAAALRRQVARRNRIALIFFALVLVVAALAVTWRVFGRMLTSRAPPAAAVEACEKALGTLRFDDTKSKEAAVVALTDVTVKYPDYVEGHAGLVTAMTLQLDDVMQRVHRLELLIDRKKSVAARLQREHTPSNWEATAKQLADQVDELIAEHKPLADQGTALDKKTRDAYKGLESSVSRVGDPTRQAKLAALRAQALYHAVSGTEQALVLTKRYDSTAEGAAPDGWIDLALPEYAANARVSDELMAQAIAKIEELHKRDSTFLRTYVLSARLHLIRRELEAATSDLDEVLLLRKDHDVATELREWVRKVPAKEEKKEAP